MIRRTAVVVLALMSVAAFAHAQDAVFTVTVPSADVHAGPSTANPVIGHATSGTVLPVSRNLGSWVRIAWPDAQDGVGYVHMTMGRVGAATNGPRQVTTTNPPIPPPPANNSVVPGPAMKSANRPRRPPMQTPASHIVGVGGLVGLLSSIGGTTRVWHDNHLGFQFGVMRDARTSAVADGRLTSLRLEPGVVYALFDRVSDYVWIRPYVGSSVPFYHQTLSVSDPVAPSTASDSGAGFRVFAGSELTFASAPRFGLGVDLGYRRLSTPFAGFETNAVGVEIAGHWYIR